MFKKVISLSLLIFSIYLPSFSQPVNKPNLSKQKAWVDSVYSSMNDEQRIAQLFMVAAYSNRDETHYAEIAQLIKQNHIGGLIFFQGGPVRQAQLTNRYQSLSKVPLLIGQDFEWGLGMRLDSVISFPRQITLGAIQDNDLIYRMGKDIGRQCKRLGVHVNFAPVIDVNTDPNNPVIGSRSFGEDKINVAEKGIAYMKGLQDVGVLACAKHFPGHGDTNVDSHYSLPVINHDRVRLDSLELYPFKRLIEEEVGSIMVAHLQVNAYDDAENTPSTLSKKTVTDLLREELGFDGLIFTDALNMKGISQYYKPGEVDLKAFKAGNDIMLFAEDVPLAIKLFKKAIKRRQISKKAISARVHKVLRSKYQAGLGDYQPISTKGLIKDLNSKNSLALIEELFESATTLVKNKDQLLPFTTLDNLNFASLTIGSEDLEFQQRLSDYAPFTHYQIQNDSINMEEYVNILSNLTLYDNIIVSFHGMSNARSNNYGIPIELLKMLQYLDEDKNLIIVAMGNPYSLKFFSDFDHLVCGYVDNVFGQRSVAQALFGAIGFKGIMPVSANPEIKVGAGIVLESLNRLGISYPERLGMDSDELNKIDQIAIEAIESLATPGCQVLVAKSGKVVFNRAYGYHTYDSLVEVTTETVYDIASITKVASTVQAIMFLEENGLLDIKQTLGHYLPELKGTNKENIYIDEMMTHQAGLQPYISFWAKTISKNGLDADLYDSYPGINHKQVSPGLFASDALTDSIWRWTVDSELRKKPRSRENMPYDYKYSDMGFYFLKAIAEKLLNQDIEEFMEQNFYAPLGLNYTRFLPLCSIPESIIAPTERDLYFRNCLVNGYVHDPGAAMIGGVGGHAGLFSTARGLATILQMNMNGGTYANLSFFRRETIVKFTSPQFEKNRRALIWDKPALDSDYGPTSRQASAKAFGHSGFTGTTAWADPEHELIYVFLSNRIYPDASNTKLIKNNIRTRIQDVVYNALFSFKKSNE